MLRSVGVLRGTVTRAAAAAAFAPAALRGGRTFSRSLLRGLRCSQPTLGASSVRLVSTDASAAGSMPAAPHADAPAALAPPSAVSVKVGGCKYSTITLDGARVLQMTEMDFLDAILGMRVFSDRFVGVHPVRCTVSVVPLPPGMKTPDEAAEAKGVPLDADQTLGAAAVESGWTGGSKLFIQVRLPDPGGESLHTHAIACALLLCTPLLLPCACPACRRCPFTSSLAAPCPPPPHPPPPSCSGGRLSVPRSPAAH